MSTFDTVVVANGTRPVEVLSQDLLLSQDLRARGFDVRVVGDAAGIGQVQGATTSAWEIASGL